MGRSPPGVEEKGLMSRHRFPEGFHWGTATAAYQIEGSPRADGKGPSIWDRFAHTPGRIQDGATGDRACDSYRRFGEDIALMKEMNLSSYRFSISWPRIQPHGRGAVNQPGIDHYRQLVEALLGAGIRPLPTLYHWDLPQALEEAGGWPERDTAGRFSEYAALTVRALGDAVSDWIILNEPSVFTSMGYLLGIHAPGRQDLDAFFRASHVVNLAQGEACRAMRAESATLRIGTAFNMSACEPARDEPEDLAAAERWHALTNLWHLEPALRGRYPDAFTSGLPGERMGIRDGDLERVRADLDFLGINLYTRTLLQHQPNDPNGLCVTPVGPMGGKEGPQTDFGWEVWPKALRDLLQRITADYDRPVMEITENGCSYADGPDTQGRVDDQRRLAYHRAYLVALAEAIEAGADVRGYHAWSLLDNFEWAEGYSQRFGLTHVDFETGTRTLKESGRWYGRVAAENGFDH
jgi:beta-glucosidase